VVSSEGSLTVTVQADAPSAPAPSSPRSNRSRPSKEVVRLAISVAFLVVMYVTIGLIKPSFFGSATFWTIAEQGAVLLLITLGATFVVMMGMIDLSVGSLVTMSAMVLAVSISDLGGPGAMALAIVATTAVATVNGLIVTMLRLPSFLVTLGTLSIIAALAALVGNTYAQFNDPFIARLALGELGAVPYVVIIALVLTAICGEIARGTTFGRGAYSIGGGERVAQIVGLPIRRYKTLAFALSGATCAVAGVLLAGRLSAGTPTIGESFLLDAVAAIAVGGTALTGGVGGPWHTAIGVFIITTLSVGLVVLQVNPNLQGVIKGVVVIAAVYFTMNRSRDLIVK
jgi:ribose transport system permease protein